MKHEGVWRSLTVLHFVNTSGGYLLKERQRLKFGINSQLKIIRTQTVNKTTALVENGYVSLNQRRIDTNNTVAAFES